MKVGNMEIADELIEIVDQFNDFDGQAMITINKGDGTLECVVGQSECYVNGCVAIVSKTMKETEEYYITADDIIRMTSPIEF